MVSYAFDETKSYLGSQRLTSTGALIGSTLIKEGVSGSTTTFSHPWPYKTGGAWTLTKDYVTEATMTGQDGAYTYDQFRAWAVPGTLNIAVPTNKSVANLLADTNPARPSVDLPVSILELRDLPRLFKIAGDTFLKKGASSYLNYQFGWKPFLNDLKGILDFHTVVDRRVRQLSALYNKGGSRHRADNGTAFSESTASDGSWQGNPLFLHRTSSGTAWITVRWIPVRDLRNNIPAKDELYEKAFRAAFGLNLNIATVWEALPWSWLIDWFSDVGDYLSVYHNNVDFVPGPCYQMVQQELYAGKGPKSLPATSSSWPLLKVDNLSTRTRVIKTRTIVTPSPITGSVPFMTPRQLGILGSLAVLRKI
jgi:hypothetical protein